MRFTTTLIITLAAAVALPPTVEACAPADYSVLYRVCAVERYDGISQLSRVEIDASTGRAEIEAIVTLSGYDMIDVMAVTTDGKTVYMVNDAWYPTENNFHLIVYSLVDGTLVDRGPVVLADGQRNRVDQLAVSPDGTVFMTNYYGSELYTLDPTTAVATPVGIVVNRDNGSSLTILGGDIAFTATGELLLWTNTGSAAAPEGMWRLSLPAIDGRVEAEYLGTGNDGNHWFTGLAVTGNGVGDVVGSNADDEIHSQSAVDGSDIAIYQTYWKGTDTPYIGHEWGDMSNGPLFACTSTRGYWRNHSWPTDVTLCNGSYTIDENLGRTQILRKANNRNHSQLVAQLVAAKLNCNDCIGMSIIDDAEDYLCNDAQIVGDGDRWWQTGFDSWAQKCLANSLKNALERFNRSDECDGGR